MINNFYSSVSNGNLVEKCSHKQHHVPEQPYLLKNNFLSEFRTALEKAKARANLGIADSETLYWGNIQGDIAEQTDIAAYIDSLLSFDYDKDKNFDAGDHFQNITNVREAAITCLDYLSKFKGEGAEIAALDEKIKSILQNLYAVDDLEDIASSDGGVINTLTDDVEKLKKQLGDPSTSVQEIESQLNTVTEEVNQINNILTNINGLLNRYVPEDGTQNALQIIEDTEVTETRPKVDDQGNPVLDVLGNPVYETVTTTKKGGLYVKDLQPGLDELSAKISGESDKITVLQRDVESNSESLTSLNDTTIPGINSEIQDIRDNYLSKNDLGSVDSIVTTDKLKNTLKDYVEINSTASLQGITSKDDSIQINKPFEFTTNDPGDSRRYVQKKSELLTVTNYWPGMEVIVVEDALMYILKDNCDPADPTYDSWKIADSLRIEVLSREEFEQRQKAGELNSSVYYYIYSESVTFKEYPVRSDYESDEDFDYAVQQWEAGTYILQGQYMSASWGQDLENRLKYKIDKANFDALSTKVSTIEKFFNATDGDTLIGLKESIQQIYTPASTTTDSEGNEVTTPAAGLLVSLTDRVDAIDERVTIIETTLKDDVVTWDDVNKGDTIVTWEDLGGSGEDTVPQGDTLFVKTSLYNKNRDSDAKEFTTEKLTFPRTTVIHHDAVEEQSHQDETTGETIVDQEAQDAYDEEVTDSLSITRSDTRIQVGDDEVAYTDDLLKSLEFDSYPIYFNWINGSGTIDGKEGSQTYDEWAKGKDPSEWYFFIKYDGTILPQKNEGESDEDYEIRIAPFKKGMLLTVYEAEKNFASASDVSYIESTLTTKVLTANSKISALTATVKSQATQINELQEALAKEQAYIDKIVEALNTLGDFNLSRESENTEGE